MNATTTTMCLTCRAPRGHACAKAWFFLRIGRMTARLWFGTRRSHAGRC